MVKWLLVCCFLVNTALALSQDFIVDDYRVDIYLHKEGYFDVIEKYNITFSEPKHGIYRTITTNYSIDQGNSKLENRRILIDQIKVPQHHFERTSFLGTRLDGQLEIKIGDKDKVVNGKQEYVIQYRVRNAFLFTDSSSQFYWNIKGNEWPAIFNHISFAIHLPSELPLSKNAYFLYSGITGSSVEDNSIPLSYTNGVLTGDSKTNLNLTGQGNNLTVLINLPVDYIEKPAAFWSIWQEWGWISYLLLIAVLYYWVWHVYGKDRLFLKIVHYFPPQGMDPAMAGYLLNDQADNSDLISLIPFWGAAGILSLQEIPKKWIFGKNDLLMKKLTDLPSTATAYEKVMFQGLFPLRTNEVLISSLKDSFYMTLNNAKSILKNEAQRFYRKESNRVSKLMIFALILAAIIGVVLSLFFWNIFGGVILVIFCAVLLGVNKILYKRNEQGDALLAQIQGYQMFVQTAEEEKLRILLNEDPGYFEKSLGYALTFGLLKKWGNKFNNLEVDPPSWYSSTGGSRFSVHSFSNSFTSSISSMQRAMVSAPSKSGNSSSGGGSSGGGFGGGGGGSW